MTANVRDLEAIRTFRGALIRFADQVVSVMDAMQIEIQRAVAWIEQDRPFYWKAQTRRAFDSVAQTRTALSSCQMRTVAGRHPSCIEEKLAYQKAKRRLEHCQDQIKHVTKWATAIRHEADEFRGRLAPLQRLVERDIPAMTVLLERISTILEDYAQMNVRPLEDAQIQPPPESGAQP